MPDKLDQALSLMDRAIGRRDASGKIKRDAFLYLPPQAPADQHAQCGTCYTFCGEERNRCAIQGDTRVTKEMSCGLYEHGEPHDQEIRAVYTPEQVGLVDRQVRCENCVASDGEGGCNLYKKLNAALPDMFDLDERIEAKGCCNAQTPRT
jgi:Pyruvate/2-oxoacid:ferredoxin oxidoreductase delta subunit